MSCFRTPLSCNCFCLEPLHLVLSGSPFCVCSGVVKAQGYPLAQTRGQGPPELGSGPELMLHPCFTGTVLWLTHVWMSKLFMLPWQPTRRVVTESVTTSTHLLSVLTLWLSTAKAVQPLGGVDSVRWGWGGAQLYHRF